MIATALNRILLVLGYAGVFVAGVLSLGALTDREVPCGLDGGCAAVAAHASSKIFGFPNAYLGFFGYVLLAGLATYRELVGFGAPKVRLTVNVGWAASAVGTIFSIYLTFISITVIHQTCKWCLASAAIMTLTLFAYMLLTQKFDAAPAGRPVGTASLLLVPILAIMAVGGIGVAFANFKASTGGVQRPFQESDITNLIGPDAHIKNPNGVVTLVEFGDLDCPNCKHVYPQLEQMVANSEGRLRYVFHNFPLYKLQDHPGALAGAMISEIAAEKGKFWEYLDAVYGTGDSDAAAPPPAAPDMINFGARIGLDPKELHKRVDNPDLNDPAFVKVQNDLRLAMETYKIRSTPGFIIITKGEPNTSVTGSAIFDVLDTQPYKRLIRGK